MHRIISCNVRVRSVLRRIDLWTVLERALLQINPTNGIVRVGNIATTIFLCPSRDYSSNLKLIIILFLFNLMSFFLLVIVLTVVLTRPSFLIRLSWKERCSVLLVGKVTDERIRRKIDTPHLFVIVSASRWTNGVSSDWDGRDRKQTSLPKKYSSRRCYPVCCDFTLN